MATPPSRRSAVDAVAGDIEGRISRGAVEVGERLGTRVELAERYGVASTTIAEAIRVLEAKGLITTKSGPQGGVFVAPRSVHSAIANAFLNAQGNPGSTLDCVRVMDALDPAITVSAAMHRTAADCADLLTLLEELRDAWPDRSRGLAANWKLHRRIAVIAPNPVLSTIYLNLLGIIEAETSDEGIPRNSDARMLAHERLVHAIVAGDVDATRDASVAHGTIVDDGVSVVRAVPGGEPVGSLSAAVPAP